MVLAEVPVGKVLGLLDFTGQETTAQRRVGKESDSELLAELDLLFGVLRPERVLRLKSRDLRDLGSAFDGVNRRFRKSNVFDFTGILELLHGLDTLFNGSFGIDTVLLVEIDVVDAETLERIFTGLLDVLGITPNSEPGTGTVLKIAYNSELCTHEEFFATESVPWGMRAVSEGEECRSRRRQALTS